MILQIICLRDSKAQAFGTPNFVVSTGSAIRSLRDEVNRNAPDNLLFKHPEDFELFHMGSYDDSTGEMSLYESLKPLIVASQLKE